MPPPPTPRATWSGQNSPRGTRRNSKPLVSSPMRMTSFFQVHTLALILLLDSRLCSLPICFAASPSQHTIFARSTFHLWDPALTARSQFSLISSPLHHRMRELLRNRATLWPVEEDLLPQAPWQPERLVRCRGCRLRCPPGQEVSPLSDEGVNPGVEGEVVLP